MVHGYYAIDLDIVGDTVKQDIPKVLDLIPKFRRDVELFRLKTLNS
ncbi:Uncharacterised protein [Oligella ureolytica]|nr:Uncharacterised protein [Oligella ureolytica]